MVSYVSASRFQTVTTLLYGTVSVTRSPPDKDVDYTSISVQGVPLTRKHTPIIGVFNEELIQKS